MNRDADRRPDDTAPARAEAAPLDLRAEVTVREDGSEECTIYPSDPIEGKYTTVWLSAGDDGFVSLAEMR